MTDRYPNRLAQALGEEIDRRGWSHRKAGTAMGLNHVTVSAIVMGTTPNPTWETLHKVASFLGLEDATAHAWLRETAHDPSENKAAVMYRESGIGGTLGAPADPAGRLVPTVLLYNPDGAVVGRSGLDDRERAAVLRVISTIDAWRAGRGDGDDGGIDPGAGDPR